MQRLDQFINEARLAGGGTSERSGRGMGAARRDGCAHDPRHLPDAPPRQSA